MERKDDRSHGGGRRAEICGGGRFRGGRQMKTD